MTLRKKTELLVVHCSATSPKMDIDAAWIDAEHRKRGFAKIGYHLVIKRDGTLERGRDINEVGAHVAGHNSNSVGVCLVGGIDDHGRPENNFTDLQFEALVEVLNDLLTAYPDAEVLGHRDLSPDLNGDGEITPDEWVKACPCFDVRDWWQKVVA